MYTFSKQNQAWLYRTQEKKNKNFLNLLSFSLISLWAWHLLFPTTAFASDFSISTLLTKDFLFKNSYLISIYYFILLITLAKITCFINDYYKPTFELYKTFDSVFYTTKDILKNVAEGRLVLPSEDLVSLIYKYLNYFPPGEGLGLIVLLTFNTNLNLETRNNIYNILLSILNPLSILKLNVTFSTMFFELDSLVFSAKRLDKTLLSHFLTLLYNILKRKLVVLKDKSIINEWLELVCKTNEFASLTNYFNTLLLKVQFARVGLAFFTILTLVLLNLILGLSFSKSVHAMNSLPARVPTTGNLLAPRDRGMRIVANASLHRPEKVSVYQSIAVMSGGKITDIITTDIDINNPQTIQIIRSRIPDTKEISIVEKKKSDATHLELEEQTKDTLKTLLSPVNKETLFKFMRTDERFFNPIQGSIAFYDKDRNEFIGAELANQGTGETKRYFSNYKKIIQTVLSTVFSDENIDFNNLTLLLSSNPVTKKDIQERAHIFPKFVGTTFDLRYGTTDYSATLLIDVALHQFIDSEIHWFLDSDFSVNKSNTVPEFLTRKKQFIVNQILNYTGELVALPLTGDARDLYLALVAARYDFLASLEIEEVKSKLPKEFNNWSFDFLFAARAVEAMDSSVETIKTSTARIQSLLNTGQYGYAVEFGENSLNKEILNLEKHHQEFKNLVDYTPKVLGFLYDQASKLEESQRTADEVDTTAILKLMEFRDQYTAAINKVKTNYSSLVKLKKEFSKANEFDFDVYNKFIHQQHFSNFADFKSLYQQDLVSFANQRRADVETALQPYVTNRLRVYAATTLELGNLKITRALKTSDALSEDIDSKPRSKSVPAVSQSPPVYQRARGDSAQAADDKKALMLFDMLKANLPDTYTNIFTLGLKSKTSANTIYTTARLPITFIPGVIESDRSQNQSISPAETAKVSSTVKPVKTKIDKMLALQQIKNATSKEAALRKAVDTSCRVSGKSKNKSKFIITSKGQVGLKINDPVVVKPKRGRGRPKKEEHPCLEALKRTKALEKRQD